MVAAVLQLLVAHVLTDCFVHCICGATWHQSTGTNAACQQALVPAAITNSPFMLRRMRQYSLGESTVQRDANAAQLGQPALGLLLQGSTSWLHSELTYVFGTWRISSSRSSIRCAGRQRRTRSDRVRVADGRAVQLLLRCWPSGARGPLLWLLLLLELLVVLLAVLLLLLLVVVVQV